MFYVFLNIRRRSTKKGGRGSVAHAMSSDVLRISSRGSARPPVGYAFMPAVGPSVHAGCQRVHAGYQRVHAGCQRVHAGWQRVHAFMQYVNVFMQAARPPGVVQYALY